MGGGVDGVVGGSVLLLRLCCLQLVYLGIEEIEGARLVLVARLCG